jgi:hypothetical protein
VDLGISGVAVKTHRSPIDVVAIQRLDAEIQKKASILTPLKQVTLTWNEIHPQGTSVYRRVVYLHEGEYLRDTQGGSGKWQETGGMILYLGVTPHIIHAMAVQSRQRHMTFRNLKDYGCRQVKLTRN